MLFCVFSGGNGCLTHKQFADLLVCHFFSASRPVIIKAHLVRQVRRTPLKQKAEHLGVGQPEEVVREHRVGAGERFVGLKAHRFDRGEDACALASAEHVLEHEGVGYARHLDATHVDGRAEIKRYEQKKEKKTQSEICEVRGEQARRIQSESVDEVEPRCLRLIDILCRSDSTRSILISSNQSFQSLLLI
jgi:hypothetical protein